MGQAYNLYAMDNQDFLLAARTATTGPTRELSPRTKYWSDRIARYLGVKIVQSDGTPADYNGLAWADSIKNGNHPFKCPALNSPIDSSNLVHYGIPYYGYLGISPDANSPLIYKLGQIKNASQKIIFMDAISPDGKTGNYYFDNRVGTAQTTGSFRFDFGRHAGLNPLTILPGSSKGRANITFADGHVDNMTPNKMFKSSLSGGSWYDNPYFTAKP